MVLAALSSCQSCRSQARTHDAPPAKDASAVHDAAATDDPTAAIVAAEQAAVERDAPACVRPVVIYRGSIKVSSSDYVHLVERGDDYVDAPIDGLDKVLAPSTRVGFTLDYPFERPLAGVVTGPFTLRRTIDAIRASFREMYAGTLERDIPGIQLNKDVTGPYGRAFHVSDDLYIERIEHCADDTLAITIGS